MLDLVIEHGNLVDGTGREAFRADIGVRDSRIVDIGDLKSAEAHRRLDVDGLVVAPGFIDVHTHYDAQVFWDPALTPSCLHGVTTVLGGNCGFTIAPYGEEHSDYLVRMLARVEGMPLDALLAGVPWTWASTAEYLRLLEGRLGVNAGFMVGHSTVRRVVMGEAASQRAATNEELQEMQDLVRSALSSGAIGFSSSLGPAHVDGEGVPVPSRHASVEEILLLSSVCREFPGTSIEFLPGDSEDPTRQELMAEISSRAQRPVNWNSIRITQRNAENSFSKLAAGTLAARKGGKVVALTMPIPSRSRYSFRTAFVLNSIAPEWAEVLSLPIEARRKSLLDATVRKGLLEASYRPQAGLGNVVRWDNKVIAQTFAPHLQGYEGRRLVDIGKEEGKGAFDALLDIVCQDQNLGTTFSDVTAQLDTEDWNANVALWRDGRAVIGASDAGAHLDFTASHDYPVFILENAVRKHRALPIEEAIHYLTDVPARLYGLRSRGRVEVGYYADMVIFDPEGVAGGPLETRFDLPAGAERLYSEPVGVEYVLVNGEVLVEGGTVGEARTGSLLRSGRDTVTPELSSVAS